jgi:hypothetical protein
LVNASNVYFTTGIYVPGFRTGAEIPSSRPFLEVHWPPVNHSQGRRFDISIKILLEKVVVAVLLLSWLHRRQVDPKL